MRGVYFVYLKSATTRGDSGAKTEVSHWKCFSLAVRRGLADSIDKKPQVAGLLFLQMVAGRAFFVGYPVFVPGFGFQRVLNDLESLSRAMFPIWAKECLSNSISQDYLRYRWLLRYVGRVKTRWGWVVNRKAAPRMSKPISGRSSLWGLLPRIAKEPGALPGSWIHGGRYKI